MAALVGNIIAAIVGAIVYVWTLARGTLGWVALVVGGLFAAAFALWAIVIVLGVLGAFTSYELFPKWDWASSRWWGLQHRLAASSTGSWGADLHAALVGPPPPPPAAAKAPPAVPAAPTAVTAAPTAAPVAVAPTAAPTAAPVAPTAVPAAPTVVAVAPTATPAAPAAPAASAPTALTVARFREIWDTNRTRIIPDMIRTLDFEVQGRRLPYQDFMPRDEIPAGSFVWTNTFCVQPERADTGRAATADEWVLLHGEGCYGVWYTFVRLRAVSPGRYVRSDRQLQLPTDLPGWARPRTTS